MVTGCMVLFFQDSCGKLKQLRSNRDEGSVAREPCVNPGLMEFSVSPGSRIFSPVNDTGFWMFKEYFNLSLKQTFLSWRAMETIVSISGVSGVWF